MIATTMRRAQPSSRNRAAGFVLAALASLPAAAAPDAGMLQKALLGRGDRFIEAPRNAATSYLANSATQTMAFGAAGIEVRPRAAPGLGAKSSAVPALRYEFASAAKVSPVGVKDSGITYNWFVGARESWATGLKSYSQVAYAGLWPGVDATYTGDSKGIKYHFDVAAGADAAAIRFIVRGASAARIAADGSVEWTVGGAVIRDESPVAFQSEGGRERVVPASFRLEPIDAATWSLAIDVAGHDRGKALTVDPAWTAFAGLVGGNSSDQVYAVTRDADGNTYACGVTASADLPTVGAYDSSYNSGDDAFIVKFNGAGAPLFVTYFGGSAYDVCTGIALHADGSIYVAGGTTSLNFPFLGSDPNGRYKRAKSGSDRDAFVARFFPAGNALQYSGVIGGPGDDQANAIGVDAAGRACITGYTTSAGFPILGGSGATLNGAMDAFAACVAAAGTGLEYSILIGGNGDVEAGRGIAVMPDGTAYVAGETDSTSGLPATAGTLRTLAGGGSDGFVAKIGPSGAISWLTLLAGTSASSSGIDRALAIAVDPADGNLLVVGETDSADFPANDAGTRLGQLGPQNAPAGNMDGFVVRMSPNGASVLSSTYLGGAGFDAAEGVAADGLGGIYVTGTTTFETPSLFPTQATDGLAATRIGGQDGFLAKLNPGPPLAFEYSGFIGSSANDAMHALWAASGVSSVLSVGGATSAVAAGFGSGTSGALGSFPYASNGVVLRINPYRAPLSITAIAGTPQSVTVGRNFALSLTVKVADADGLGVSGFSVTFLPPPASGASATLGPAIPVTTDGGGMAQVSAMANGSSGVYGVQATAPGVAGAANFQLTNVARKSLDLDGDGKNDLVWEHPDGRILVWVMDGAASTAAARILGKGTGWSVAKIADMDGDGKSDLIVQNTDGRVAIWLMNATTPPAMVPILNAGSGWSVVGTPDLNGDGKADLVFQHTDGRVAAWIMNGTLMTAGATIMGPATGWTVVRTGDFDGDGKDDLLWKHTDGRHAIWLMNGITPAAQTQILDAGGWTARHVADLNGDGHADIVWQHTDGSVAAWLMNGATMTGGSGLLGASSGWSVTRTGDFNGDGKADLLFMHTDGRAAIWLMNGLTPAAQTQILNAGGWSARRVEDMNGDGKADIVWQHTDGSVAIWLMNGAAMASGSTIQGPATGWSVSAASQ